MIAVGRITRSVGLKGELNIASLTDAPDRFGNLRTVWVGKDEEHAVKHPVDGVRGTKSAVVLKLGGIDDRTAADKRRGEFIFVAENDTVRPKRGSYFIHEIVGMKVVTEEAEAVGIVQEVMQLPANDVWVVRNGDREYLIPAIKEVIRKVDGKNKLIVIHPLEGLLE